MVSDVTYELLWQVTQKEKHTNELQALPKTFYADIGDFIKSFENRETSEEEQNIKKNTLRLANELFERRKQKIMIYVAYKRQLPQPTVQREADLYNRLLDVANGEKLEPAGRFKASGTQTLRSLQSIPEIILPSGKRVGPLEKGQIVEVAAEEEDIKFLINNTICQES